MPRGGQSAEVGGGFYYVSEGRPKEACLEI